MIVVNQFIIKSEVETPWGIARTGCLSTQHGDIQTPVFMPVATQGTVKSMSPQEVWDIGYRMILVNAYHLYLRPGPSLVSESGGLHTFMSWPGSVLSDSGGFQIFSLNDLAKVTEAGVSFKSHIDGSAQFLTPETVIEIQLELGSDILMPLDHCMTSNASHSELLEALERTNRWFERSLKQHRGRKGQLVGIVQGGLFEDLRTKSVEFLAASDLPGFAIGGLGVGESKAQMHAALELVTKQLPQAKPRYLMGIGSPEDFVNCVCRGVDMFDCVLPTRVARNGALFTRFGRVDIHQSQYKNHWNPISDTCLCYTCSNFSLGYIHHLFKSREILGLRLATIHNLHFIHQLMDDLRLAIDNGNVEEFAMEFLAAYKPTSEEMRLQAKDRILRDN